VVHVAAVAQSVSGVESRWIINRRLDLSLVIGSGLAGYAYLLLYTAFHLPASFLWWFWSLGFDGTHIFGTASRTFFDRESRARHPAMLYGSLLFFFALGPVMVLAGAKGYLALLVAIWAYYHVMRQHEGFLILYKVKNHDLKPLDNALDRMFLTTMLVFPPFLRFFIRHPRELGLPFSLASYETAAWAVIGAAALLWAGRQTVRLARGEPINWPKYLLLAAVIPLHWLTFALVSWQAATPIVTIVHNLQYHAIVWFHNRNRYTEDGSTARNGAIPATVARSLLAYAGMALLFSVAYRVPGAHLQNVSGLAFGFFCGFGMTHYFLDSRIWRVRHDPGLRQALQLA
jgi:hypothetical protein